MDGPGEVGRLTDLPDDLGAERVEADEEALEDGHVRKEVAGRMADDPFISMHTDDLGLLLCSRYRIPCGAERRIERIPVAADRDVGDLQAVRHA